MHLKSIVAFLLVSSVAVGLAGCEQRAEGDQLAKAKSLLAASDRKGAIVALKAAIQKSPQAVDARYLLGKALLDEGDSSSAMVELQKAADLGHPDSEVLPPLVRAMTLSGRAKQAVEQFGQVKIAQPVGQAALDVALAVANAVLGDDEATARHIASARTVDQNNVDAKVLEVRLQASRKDFAGALTVITDIVSAHPGHAGAWHLQGILLRYSKLDYGHALAAQRKAVSLEPRNIAAHSEVMGMLFDAKDIAGMREHFKMMKASLPLALTTQIFEAQIEYLAGNIKRSRELVQHVISRGQEDLRALLLAAQIELKYGSLVQAESYLNKVLTAAPQSRAARYYLAATYIRMGQPERAEGVLKPLLEGAIQDPEALGLAAEALLLVGELGRAQRYFELAAQANPGDPRVGTAAALVRIARGKVDEGIADLSRLAAASKDTYADLALVSVMARRGDYPAAMKAADSLVAKDGNRALSHFVRGDVLVRMGDISAAIASFQRALEIDPVYFQAASALSALAVRSGDFVGAKRHYETLLKRDPTLAKAHLAIAGLKRAKNEAPESILASLSEAVTYSPQDPGLHALRANYLISVRKYKQALEASQSALSRFPDSPLLLEPLGVSHAAVGEYQQALAVFRKWATLQPKSPQPHSRQADVFASQKDITAARQSLVRASELDPRDLRIDVRLMDLAVAQADEKEALAIARKVRKKAAGSNLGLLMEGKVHAQSRRWNEAVLAFRAAIALAPTPEAAVGLHKAMTGQGNQAAVLIFETGWLSQHPRDVAFREYLGGAAISHAQWARAESHIREVLTVKPTDPDANNNMAWVLLKQGKKEAAQYIDKALSAAPDRASYLDTAANVRLLEGDAANAKRLGSAALAADPSFHAARLTMARAMLLEGNKSGARKELEALAYLGDAFGGQAEVQELFRALQN